MPRIFLNGKKFGKLRVTTQYRTDKRKIHWLCNCDCGNSKYVRSDQLVSGKTKSCGCLTNNPPKHGLSRAPEYYVWTSLIQRCTNKNNNAYKDYGGRGINVDVRWLSFETFYKDMGVRTTNKHQIDRRNNNKGYSKENCRWVLPVENARNTRRSKFYMYNNKERTIPEIAEIVCIKKSILYGRILTYKWSMERALATPVKTRRRKNLSRK